MEMQYRRVGKKEVLKLLCMSEREFKKVLDGEFPKPVFLSISSKPFWIFSEITNWIDGNKCLVQEPGSEGVEYLNLDTVKELVAYLVRIYPWHELHKTVDKDPKILVGTKGNAFRSRRSVLISMFRKTAISIVKSGKCIMKEDGSLDLKKTISLEGVK